MHQNPCTHKTVNRIAHYINSKVQTNSQSALISIRDIQIPRQRERKGSKGDEARLPYRGWAGSWRSRACRRPCLLGRGLRPRVVRRARLGSGGPSPRLRVAGAYRPAPAPPATHGRHARRPPRGSGLWPPKRTGWTFDRTGVADDGTNRQIAKFRMGNLGLLCVMIKIRDLERSGGFLWMIFSSAPLLSFPNFLRNFFIIEKDSDTIYLRKCRFSFCYCTMKLFALNLTIDELIFSVLEELYR